MPPSPPQLVKCPRCKSQVPFDAGQCEKCGNSLESAPADAAADRSPGNSDEDFEVRDPAAGLPAKKSSGFSGIFQMAEEVGAEPEKLKKQSPGDVQPKQPSGYSGIFQMADDDSGSSPAPRTVDASGQSASRKKQASSSKASGVFRMPVDEKQAEIPAPSNGTSQRQPAPAVPNSQPPQSSQAPNAPTSGFSGVFRVADDVRSGQTREEFGQHPVSPQPPTAQPAKQTPAKSSPKPADEKPPADMMSSIEIEGETPPPENRNATPSAPNDVIRLTCKKCGRKLRVKKKRAGQKVKCPKCEHAIQVPAVRETPRDSDQDTNFADLAKEMEPANAHTDGGKGHVSKSGKKSENRKALSGRKYRQLTKRLEAAGNLNAQQIRQRADACKELGQSGDSRVYDLLVAELDHAELQVRQAAVVGLGELGDSRCVPLLVGFLDDHSMVMRKAAILGLGKIQDPRAIKPLLLFGLNDPQMKFLASEAILGISEQAVQPLMELLDNNEPGLVLEAIVLLGRLKDPRARRALSAVIDARQPLLQCHAIEALGQIADAKSIGPLSRLLEDADANVRSTAAAALSKMSADKNIVAPLVNALKDADAEVVVQAARGLGETGDRRAAEPLSRLLCSPHEKVRVASAQALGALGDQRAVPQLLALLDVDSEETQIKVLTTLRIIKPPHISGNLLKHLEHPNPAIRRRVVDVLGPIGDAEAAERLEHILRVDPADEVRMAAARSLGEIADPASVDCLKDALANDEFNVRCQAIAALGQIGDEECYGTLLALLEDQVPEARFHAASALGEVGNDKAIPPLKELLKDTNPMVVRGAAKSLEKLGVADVEGQIKKAQRSRKMEAFHGALLSVKSWLPETVHMQKLILGGSLAALLLIGGLGWLIVKMFQGPADRVIVRGNVQNISFLPNGSNLAVGRTLGLVEIWNADSARLEEQVSPPGGQRVTGTPDPKVLAIISGTAIQLWRIGGTKEFQPQSGHSTPITRYVATPDQSLLATLSADGVAIVWDLKTGQPREAVRLPAKELRGFTMSADGGLFASGDEKGGVTIWDAASGQKLAHFAGSSAVGGTCFSPDGRSLAVAFDKEMLVWNVETGQKTATLSDVALLSQIQFDPSGGRLLGVSGTSVLIWDAATLSSTPTKPQQVSVDAEQIDALAFSPDGSKFAVGGTDNSTVWVFDTASGRELNQLDTR